MDPDFVKQFSKLSVFTGRHLPPPPFNKQYPKCSISSEACRLEGNEMFKLRQFELAHWFYNQCLCYAPPGSKYIPLAYGNRSAVYCEMGKYALAIENIELARKNGFLAEKMTQLDVREAKCKKLMETFGPDKIFDPSSLFKLSHPPNKKIPFIVDCLELRKNEKYGRHIVTTKDLKTGDIIAIESSVFAWLNEKLDPACFFCAETNGGSLIPCSHCSSVMYCSEECQKKAAVLHLNNGFKQNYSGLLQIPLKMLLEAFRVAGGVDELLELLKDAEDKTIFDFDFSNPDDPSYEKNMLIAMNGLWKFDSLYGVQVKHFLLLNIPPINEKPRTTEHRRQLLKIIIDMLQLFWSNAASNEGMHQKLFLFKSLLIHSCFPNANAHVFGRKSVLFAIRPVKAGEPISLCYGPNAMYFTKEERQKYLKQKFYFKCDCEACIKDYQPTFPRNGNRCVTNFAILGPSDAIKQFKKNCKHIDKNIKKMSYSEVSKLHAHNMFLIQSIGGDKDHW